MKELLAEHGELLAGLSSVFIAFIAMNVKSFFKNRFASQVFSKFTTGAKKELGEENYNELVRIGKEYGVKKLEQLVVKFAEQNEQLTNEVSELRELLKLVVKNQLALGLYSENQTIEEEVKKRV